MKQEQRSMRSAIRGAVEAMPGGASLLEQYRTWRRMRRWSTEHRAYVGGMWEEVGTAQFAFMIRQGLTPQDILVDIACGSLRAGRLFIACLDPGRYLGLEHNAWLIEAGLKHEISEGLRTTKRPEFLISDTFEFHAFRKRPNWGLAQSLFSHLTKEDISLCLANLRAHVEDGGRFYATFVPTRFLPNDYVNPDASDDIQTLGYDAEELLSLGRETGWQASYLGKWGHPRGQEMLEFIAE